MYETRETQGFIKNFQAIDLTNASAKDVEFYTKNGYKIIAVSAGKYGRNGVLLQASDGMFFKVVGRVPNLFMI